MAHSDAALPLITPVNTLPAMNYSPATLLRDSTRATLCRIAIAWFLCAQCSVGLAAAFDGTQPEAAQAAATPPNRPEIVVMPPPWTGNGRCLRDMLRCENEWSKLRGSIQSIGYWPWLLNVHFNDDQIRELFSQLKRWNLKIGFEVPVLKAANWGGDSLPLQSRQAFEQLQRFTARFKKLGMEEVSWFSFDEPLYAARHVISSQSTPEQRLALGISETAQFIAMTRQAYPASRVGDIEPFPALTFDEISSSIRGVQEKCAAQQVRGLDFLRLDVDWDRMERNREGSWADVMRIESFCRANGIAFGLIYWSADQPRLAAAGQSSDRLWRSGIMRQWREYAAAGGSPDQIILESWLHVPERAVPESDPDTFTGAALEFLRSNVPDSSAK